VSFKFIDTLENYEVTSSNSENSGSGSSDSESEEEEWNSSRDTDYYDPDEEDFDFTDGDWDQYESNRNAEDPANTYTNEGASATNIEQENTDDEKREQFETSPEDAGLLQVN
ncbi:MAG: hypothetical protein Q8Q21_00890, partial [bacterium]|nr:hypothetical protein [bacterium]